MLTSPLGRLALALVLLSGTARGLVAQIDAPVDGERPIEFRARGDTVDALEGRITVPLVRSDPASREITLRYVRFPATTATPGSPIVYLAGGPGGSGIDGMRGNRHEFFMGLRAIADVVALDQRGTGDSEPDDVVCRHERGHRADRPGSRETYLTVIEEEVERCVRRLRERGIDVRGFTTAESADDVEALRRRLGTPRLTLLGSSYGTHLALAVARRHPGSVDRLILAGVEGPVHTIKLPGNVERNLRDVAARVREDPLYAERLPELVGTIDSLVAALEREPVEVELIDRTIIAGPWDLREFVASTIGRRSSLEGLPSSIDAFRRGRWTELGRWVERRRAPGATHAMSRATDCASYASAERLERIRSEAPDAVTGAAIDFPLPEVCDVPGLPRLGDDFRAPLDLDIPALLISGALDGRTPLSNAREVAEGMPRARHLVLENAGHGAELVAGSPAIAEAIHAFLRGEPSPDRLTLPPWTFDPPVERSLAREVLERLERDGFEATAAWYRRALADHRHDRVYDFSEGVLNRLGYDLLAADRVERAVEVFRLNVIGYPEAFNPWDSLGEGYMNAGETEKAIESYRRSLELEPANDNARRMLQQLREASDTPPEGVSRPTVSAR